MEFFLTTTIYSGMKEPTFVQVKGGKRDFDEASCIVSG